MIRSSGLNIKIKTLYSKAGFWHDMGCVLIVGLFMYRGSQPYMGGIGNDVTYDGDIDFCGFKLVCSWHVS